MPTTPYNAAWMHTLVTYFISYLHDIVLTRSDSLWNDHVLIQFSNNNPSNDFNFQYLRVVKACNTVYYVSNLRIMRGNTFSTTACRGQEIRCALIPSDYLLEYLQPILVRRSTPGARSEKSLQQTSLVSFKLFLPFPPARRPCSMVFWRKFGRRQQTRF